VLEEAGWVDGVLGFLRLVVRRGTRKEDRGKDKKREADKIFHDERAT
jgi:hypothetical protein